MELSETVKSSLRDAQEDLKNALAYAARTEKPFVSKHIATLLADIENLIDATEMIDKIENNIDTEDIKTKSTAAEKIEELIKAIEILKEKLDKVIEASGISNI